MWRKAWRWLIQHYDMRDGVVSVPPKYQSQPGIEPVRVRARCPFCKDGMGRHRAFAVEPEGDLLQCSTVWDHIWVRGAEQRQKERNEDDA